MTAAAEAVAMTAVAVAMVTAAAVTAAAAIALFVAGAAISDCFFSCGRGDWGSCCLCNNGCIPAPSPPAPCSLPAAARTWIYLDRGVAAGANSSLAPLAISSSPTLSTLSHTIALLVQIPYDVGLKLVLLVEKSKPSCIAGIRQDQHRAVLGSSAYDAPRAGPAMACESDFSLKV